MSSCGRDEEVEITSRRGGIKCKKQEEREKAKERERKRERSRAALAFRGKGQRWGKQTGGWIRKDWPRERKGTEKRIARGGIRPHVFASLLPITPPGRDNWGHRGPVGLASHGFVPSLLSHGYESKNLGLDVYTCLHVYTRCPAGLLVAFPL